MSGKLKEVRERIKSVQSTQQITKAMKMVSAAKLRKAQTAITQMRPYANRLNKMLRNIVANLEGDIQSPYAVMKEPNKVCVVVVTSNRGLCGAFNTNIIKEAVKTIEELFSRQRAEGNVSIFFVGKKGYDVMKKKYSDCNLITDYIDLFSDLTYENMLLASQALMDAFADSTYDIIDVCYSQFKNAAVQEPTTVTFLPVVKLSELKEMSKLPKSDYIFEPGKEELLVDLIPSILHTSFRKFLYDTHASEHGARMTAMDNATTNAEELMKVLKINYNKARQEAITKELSEIVGGAAALNG